VANSEHLAELKKGVESWNGWRASNQFNPDLSGANLSGANLERAKFRTANLGRATLDWANLRGANLEGANLEGANLEGALCGETLWCDLNLLETIGLSKLVHDTSSTLGTNTLALSKGRLPVEFLKGCGLADWEIESAKLHDPDLTTAEITDIQYRIYDLLARGPIQISPVFISYSHGDKVFVDGLGCKLDQKGVRYWRDIKDAIAGRLDKVIERGISLNPTVLLVLSEHSVKSDWVEDEVDKAVKLSRILNRDVLCPIALDESWVAGSRMSDNLFSPRNRLPRIRGD
jgi:hypothetical protein